MDDALINKTMDRDDLVRPDCRRILTELFGLMRRMNRLDAAAKARARVNASQSLASAGLQDRNRSHACVDAPGITPRKSQLRMPIPVGSTMSRSTDRPSLSNLAADADESNLSDPATNSVELDATQVGQVGYSSWYGRLASWPGAWEHINRGVGYEPFPGNPDELKVPWFLLWEIAWLVANTPLRPGSRVLDMGGAGSLFSCFLASRGHDVVAIDIDADLCRRADAIGAAMNWRLRGEVMDMAELDFADASFDHVFSVCVFEHLPVSGRVRCNEHIRRILKPGGTASYTFDYANPQAFGRLATPADVNWQFVEPSGLAWRGTPRFVDTGKRYLSCPQSFGFGRFTESAARFHALLTGSMERSQVLTNDTEYTFGALFLQKEAEA